MADIDRKIAEAILGAQGLRPAAMGLRFDRVAVSVLGEMRAFVEGAAPAGVVVLATLTAPIRLPARTAEALTGQIGALLARPAAGGDLSLSVHGNAARLRLVGTPAGVVLPGSGFVGFVHNPSAPADRLLDLAEAWVRGLGG